MATPAMQMTTRGCRGCHRAMQVMRGNLPVCLKTPSVAKGRRDSAADTAAGIRVLMATYLRGLQQSQRSKQDLPRTRLNWPGKEAVSRCC